MASIRASWRRVVQVRPYETETLELAMEVEVKGDKPSELQALEDLSRDISVLGDQLLIDRQKAYSEQVRTEIATTAVAYRRNDDAMVGYIAEPDPFV